MGDATNRGPRSLGSYLRANPKPRSHRPTVGAALAALLLMTALPPRATAQEESVTIALFAPGIYFNDSVARAGFISALAAEVAAEAGVAAEGVNLSSTSRLQEADFAIIDGVRFAGQATGRPIGSAQGGDGSSAPMGLIVGASGPARLSELAGSTLILPRSGDRLVEFISAEILRGEIPADEFFGAIEYTSNIESALAAVADGQADATVGFASYGGRGGLSTLSTHGDAPMPVLVQLNNSLDGALVERVAEVVRAAATSGEITGFTNYDADSVSAFSRRATRPRAPRVPLMTRPRSISVDPGDIELPEVDEPLVLGRPVDLILLPDMEEP